MVSAKELLCPPKPLAPAQRLQSAFGCGERAGRSRIECADNESRSDHQEWRGLARRPTGSSPFGANRCRSQIRMSCQTARAVPRGRMRDRALTEACCAARRFFETAIDNPRASAGAMVPLRQGQVRRILMKDRDLIVSAAIAPGEGALTGQHLVQDGAEREYVGVVIHRLAAHLFGCHITDRPQHHPRSGVLAVTVAAAGRFSAGSTSFARPKSRIFTRPSS